MAEPKRLPESFLSEVAAAQVELAELAPRLLALADRYVRIEATFRELVPHGADDWDNPWAESGADQLQDRMWDLAERFAEPLGIGVM